MRRRVVFPSQMKILCADDDADIRAVLEVAFSLEADIEVDVVGSGVEVLERVELNRYDVIVLDGWMPGLDGYETCECLRANAATRAIPVVFLTANSDRAQIERARNCGGRGTIVKPFDPLTLISELRELVQF